MWQDAHKLFVVDSSQINNKWLYTPQVTQKTLTRFSKFPPTAHQQACKFVGKDIKSTPDRRVYERSQITTKWHLISTLTYMSQCAHNFYHKVTTWLNIWEVGLSVHLTVYHISRLTILMVLCEWVLLTQVVKSFRMAWYAKVAWLYIAEDLR